MTAQRRDARGLLIAAAVITVALWQFPIGRTILYPFTLLATYAHEMGHGLTALVMGAEFESLKMYANGSGLAAWRGHVGAIGRALIAAGGLVGPSIAGVIVLVISRDSRRAPRILMVLGVVMALTGLIWARSLVAIGFISITAATFIVVGRYFATSIAPFFVQLVGVQLCLAVFRDVRYMFSPGGVIDGQLHRSDSAAIAEALFLPYWFWGGVVALTAFAVLALGLWAALRGQRDPPAAKAAY